MKNIKKECGVKVYLSAYHEEVTGSRFLLNIEFPNGRKHLVAVDYGYFQEKEYQHFNYYDDINPENIDAILVTHNHIDHMGLIPKAVNQGYRKSIYMTEITSQLVYDFWEDSLIQQEDNIKELKRRMPEMAWRFKNLFHHTDVIMATKLCVPLKFRKEREILPGVYVTFFENGHLLGAAMIYIRISYRKNCDMHFLFTGDYKSQNTFFKVKPLPNSLIKRNIILISESTYGTTNSDEIEKCFDENIKEAFSKKQSILIGAFAQGRMQEILYRLKLMQDKNEIPSVYEIYIDGKLGIKTNEKYKRILRDYNPKMKDFMPKNVKIVDKKSRNAILDDNIPKILVTTSGMLSNGPARNYVPMFLKNPKCMIHLTGYAAKGTLARKLLEAKESETIKIGSTVYEKKADIKTTMEFSSHSLKDQILEFIGSFKNLVIVIFNHGQSSVKDELRTDVIKTNSNLQVETIDRSNMFCFYQEDKKGGKLRIKKVPAKLNINHKINIKHKKRKKVHKR